MIFLRGCSLRRSENRIRHARIRVVIIVNVREELSIARSFLLSSRSHIGPVL